MEALPEIYPLTGLQIGDIQSYVSRAFMYFAPQSDKFFVLVDNRPWLLNQQSKSARLWQLMVTKYRMSPFANTKDFMKATNAVKDTERNRRYTSNRESSKRLHRWFPVIDSAKWQELSSVMDLSKALHGFLVFEVAWKDVHGINYLNELQVDTNLALEVKSMNKWEFYSPDQASRCASLWFSDRTSEIQSLKSNLRNLSDLDLHGWSDDSSSKEMLLHKKPPSDVSSDAEFVDLVDSSHSTIEHADSIHHCNAEHTHHTNMSTDAHDHGSVGTLEVKESLDSKGMDEGISDIVPTHYKDTLLLFRFNNSLLPFKLRHIIISEVRLLTLLESGLPSWVIFFQSYPLFCHFYRPWMRHLARTLYVLISLVTVIIGFYDLYKNVPLLKATASRVCGPLFVWIEEWDMVSRIRYLGTMLFLQNLEKGFKWLVIFTRGCRTVLVTIARPFSVPLAEIAEFISPFWEVFAQSMELFSSGVWIAFESVYNICLDLVEVLVSPFELLYSYVWTIAISVYPPICSLWRLFLAPVRCMLPLASYVISLLSNIDDMVKDVWEYAHRVFQLANLSKAKQGADEISLWRGLWKDLFSKVFQASRSVLKVLVAFLITCNRHRLSIYNHIRTFFYHLAQVMHLSANTCRCQKKLQIQHQQKEGNTECDRCK